MSTHKNCDIFISYRREGGDMTAMYIYQELKERKYNVFYDLEVLRAGKFNESLLEYIASCKDFILVLSPGALDRCDDEGDWVRKEIAEALRLKKNIIPIMLKGFRFPDTLPDEIDEVRYQNGLTSTTEYFKESMNRLCEKYLRSKAKKNIALYAGITSGVVLIAILALLIGKNLPSTKNPDSANTIAVTEAITEAPTEESTSTPAEAISENPEAMNVDGNSDTEIEVREENSNEQVSDDGPYYSRNDLFTAANTEHTVSVIWKQDEKPVICASAFDEDTGHSYVFVNCPATAQAAIRYMGEDYNLVAVNSEEEFRFLEQWAQQDNLNFTETWIMGYCNPAELYRDHDADFDLKKLWQDFSEQWIRETGMNCGSELYFAWDSSQPDASGLWLQLFQYNNDGKAELYMDDLNDMLRRPFIIEYNRAIQDGEVIDLSWQFNGGDEHEGYGELYHLPDEITERADLIQSRMDEKGRYVITGSGCLGLSPDTWYNLYIREVIINEGLTGIDFHAFDGCANLKSITIPNSVTRIGEMAFSFTALSEITIPSSVTQIHESAFDFCPIQMIRGESGSYAETFAKENGINFSAK